MRSSVPLGLPAFLGFALLGSAVLSGCSCEEDRPYTPFTVAQKPADPAAITTAAPVSSAVAPKAEVVLAPTPSRVWPVFGRKLLAPPDGKFVLAASLPGPSAADPARVVAWVTGPATSHGLWLHNEAGKPERRVAAAPSFLPDGPDCSEKVELIAAGADTLTLDVSRDCGLRHLPGAPVRAFLVLSLTAPEPLLLGFRVAPLSVGEQLALGLNSADQDGDGAQDFDLSVTLTTPNGEPAKAALHWLNRPAGPSRQADTPGHEFSTRGAELVIAGQRKADRARVPAQVEALRRLYAVVCAEAASARLSTWDGGAIRCGNLDASLNKLTLAVIHAQLGLKQPGRALGELERAGWFGSKPTDKERAALEKVILARLPTGAPTKLLEVSATLLPRPAGVPGSRLSFENDGRLWALESATSTRLLWPRAPDEGSDGGSLPESGVFPWSLDPTGPDGRRAMAVLPSCDRAEVLLALVDGTGRALPSVPLGLLAPRPGQCKAAFGGGPLTAQTLGWRGDKLELLLAGQVWASDASSPETSALSTSLGFFVSANGTAELWRDPFFRAGLECVSDRERKHAACVDGAKVVLFERPGALTPPTP